MKRDDVPSRAVVVLVFERKTLRTDRSGYVRARFRLVERTGVDIGPPLDVDLKFIAEYVANAPKGQMADHIADRATEAVFGRLKRRRPRR